MNTSETNPSSYLFTYILLRRAQPSFSLLFSFNCQSNSNAKKTEVTRRENLLCSLFIVGGASLFIQMPVKKRHRMHLRYRYQHRQRRDLLPMRYLMQSCRTNHYTLSKSCPEISKTKPAMKALHTAAQAITCHLTGYCPAPQLQFFLQDNR